MMTKVVKLPEYEWFDPKEVEYYLPDSWDVTVYDIAGANRPAMTAGEIKEALKSPIGTPTIRELARGRKKVVILFDDMTRGTQAFKVAPVVQTSSMRRTPLSMKT